MFSNPSRSRDTSPNQAKEDDQRRSRRQLGLPPEHGLLPEKPPATKEARPVKMSEAQLPTAVVLQQPREPPKFRGTQCDDPEDWLEQFERVAAINKWNDEAKLQWVYFTLEESARTWFINHESVLRTWEDFKGSLLRTFSSVARKERAERQLHSRFQLPNESVAVFVEEMKHLFGRADPEMPEEKKLGFLIRGVKEELFAGLMRNPPQTVSQFVTEAAAMEKILDVRRRQYGRPAPVGGTSPAELNAVTVSNLRDTIKAVVQEELRKMFPSSCPQVATLSDVVRQEVQQALGTGPLVPPSQEPEWAPRGPQIMSYAAAARNPVRPAQPTYSPPPRPQPNVYRPPAERAVPRKSDVWRTDDHRPLCFHCGEPGHLYRNCFYRNLGLRGFHVGASRPQPGQRPAEIEDYLQRQSLPAGRCRSPSPSSRRYPSPHPANTGASRGRSPSPHLGN